MRPIQDWRVRPLADLAVAILIFLATLLIAGVGSAATTSVHIEWKRGGHTYGGQSLSSSGTAAASSGAPNFGDTSATGGTVRIVGTAGASIVLVAPGSPVATQTNGIYLAQGDPPLEVPVNPGDKVSIIAATDQPTAIGGGGTGGTVSLTLPTGATPFRCNVGNSDGTTATCLAAQGAGIRIYVLAAQCRNPSATDIKVTFSDTAASQFPVPQTLGNNIPLNDLVPLVTAENAALTIAPSETVTDWGCAVQGYSLADS